MNVQLDPTRLDPRKIQQVTDKHMQAICIALGNLQETRLLCANCPRRAHQDQVDVALDRSQRRPQLVRHNRYKIASHTINLGLMGEIAKDSYCSGHLAWSGPNGGKTDRQGLCTPLELDTRAIQFLLHQQADDHLLVLFGNVFPH